MAYDQPSRAVPPRGAAADGDVLALDASVPTGTVWAAPGGGGGGAPTVATYVTITNNATLTNERMLAVGSGLSLVDGGANSTATLDRAALTGDVTASAGSNATTIANNAVTYAKLQNVSATARILARKTAGSGNAEEATLSEVLDFGTTTNGHVLQRVGGTWTGTAIAGLTGLVPTFDPEARVTGPTYHAGSAEFFVNQGTESWTDALNPGAVAGLSQASGPHGIEVVLPGTGGATARLLGYYKIGGFPSNDFSCTACLSVEGAGIANATGGLFLAQGTGATDDWITMGLRNGTAGNVLRHGRWTAYNAFAADDFLGSNSVEGRIWVAFRYAIAGKTLALWMGKAPDALTLFTTTTLTNAATIVGIGGQGVNSAGTTPCTVRVHSVNIVEEAYSATAPPTQTYGVRRLVA